MFLYTLNDYSTYSAHKQCKIHEKMIFFAYFAVFIYKYKPLH